MIIEQADIHVETWPQPPTGGMLTGNIPVGIKITHIKTGIYAICEKHRQMYKNRDEALFDLGEKLRERS